MLATPTFSKRILMKNPVKMSKSEIAFFFPILQVEPWKIKVCLDSLKVLMSSKNKIKIWGDILTSFFPLYFSWPGSLFKSWKIRGMSRALFQTPWMSELKTKVRQNMYAKRGVFDDSSKAEFMNSIFSTWEVLKDHQEVLLQHNCFCCDTSRFALQWVAQKLY